MNKYEFMYNLNKELEDLGVTEISEIMDDYEEHFRIGETEGRSDEEIVAQLGDPKEIARSYCDGDQAGPDTEETKSSQSESVHYAPVNDVKDNTNKWIIGAILAIVVIFVVVPVLSTVLGILIGMFALSGLLIFSAFGLFFTPLGSIAGTFILAAGLLIVGIGIALLAVWATWGIIRLCIMAWNAGVKLIKEA
ncbi:MAG: DUF1700 domain-containing protein [Clostridia bacterium]|nr:DUF1700 domain-containing protein [Clostridia bacterium]